MEQPVILSSKKKKKEKENKAKTIPIQDKK